MIGVTFAMKYLPRPAGLAQLVTPKRQLQLLRRATQRHAVSACGAAFAVRRRAAAGEFPATRGGQAGGWMCSQPPLGNSCGGAYKEQACAKNRLAKAT